MNKTAREINQAIKVKAPLPDPTPARDTRFDAPPFCGDIDALEEDAKFSSNTERKYQYALIVFHGSHGKHANSQHALGHFISLAERDHLPSVIMAARIYELGTGISIGEPEPQLAIRYYMQAAILGCETAKKKVAMSSRDRGHLAPYDDRPVDMDSRAKHRKAKEARKG